MPLSATVSLDVVLLAGFILSALGIIIHQWGWILGGVMVTWFGVIGSEGEDRRREKEELAEGIRRG